MNGKITSIREGKNLKGKIVLLRLDLNMSIQNGKIENDFRLRRSLTTLEYLRKEGAKVVIISHIESEGVNSLSEIFTYCEKYFPVDFITDPIPSLKRERFEGMKEGSVVLLENLRQYPGEKKNDKDFVDVLSALGDIFVNEAFSVSHRSHASIVGIPTKLPSYCGFVFEQEIENLSESFSPKKPFLFILGGAKFDTKLPLLEKFLTIADSIYLCGALANDCWRALGFEIGRSVASPDTYDLAHMVKNKKIILPKDVVVKNKDVVEVKSPSEVGREETIIDAGPQALLDLKKLTNTASFILWNGPLGLYEEGFKQSTMDTAKMIAESGAKCVIGGGDTLSAIDELHMEEKFTFVSTGGGAMLDFLAKETLPGIEALKQSV